MKDKLLEILKQVKVCGESVDEYYLNGVADYLLANGVIVPPCKTRERLYAIFNNKVVKGIAKSLEIVIEENKISYIVGLQFFKGIIISKEFSFGKNIFLTKEEAEAKLKEI